MQRNSASFNRIALKSIFSGDREHDRACNYVTSADPLSSYVSGVTVAVTRGKPFL
jgi:hypothetical protein